MSGGYGLYPIGTDAAIDAWTRLCDALIERGPSPCSADPIVWDTTPLDLARRICAACPIRTECDDYANASGQQHLVWAGIDRSRRHVSPVFLGDDARPASQQLFSPHDFSVT